MSLIALQNVSFGYEGSGDMVFENLNLTLDSDWRLGFIGRNGKGKTTLLKILSGELIPTGKIVSSVDFEYFPYRVENESAVVNDIFAALCPDSMEWERERELAQLDVDAEVLERPFNTLSNGERSKVLLAVLFLKSNSFLLIDEPTNHLDIEARESVAKYLKQKKGFILVSHDRRFVDNCVDHILSVNRQSVEVQRGNFSSWLTNKERQDSFERGKNEKLKSEIDRLQDSMRRKSDWAGAAERAKYEPSKTAGRDTGFIGHKAAKAMKSAKVLEDRRSLAINEKSGLLKDVENEERLLLEPLVYNREVLARAKDLSVSYDGRMIFDGISFQLERGDRLRIKGGNGSGKTSILKLFSGELKNSETDSGATICGNFEIGGNMIISYLPQNVSNLSGSLKEFSNEKGIDLSRFMTVLRKMGFERAQFEKDISEFSEGQKKKAALAAGLCTSAHLYIWDEPLNFIDVISRMQIEELIFEFQPTIVFVEHDAAFSERVATATIQL